MSHALEWCQLHPRHVVWCQLHARHVASPARSPLFFVPTVRGIPGPYRFFYYSVDCNEQMHVHARRERVTCKFWLDGVALAANYGLTPHDLAAVRRIIFEHRRRIVEAWYEHCGNTEE